LGAALTVSAMAANTQAATLYFDGNGDGTLDGTGTWTTSGFNGSPNGQWSQSATLTLNPGPYGAWDQVGGQDIARIAGTTGIVTISGTVNADRVYSSPANQTLTGGTLNLTGAAIISATGNFFISSNITGSNGLNKTTDFGGAILTLSGVNTYSGNTVNNFGQLRAGSNTALPATTIVTLDASGQLPINGNVSAQISGVNGTGDVNTAAGGFALPRTLTLNRAAGTETFNGRFTTAGGVGGSTLNLIKSGGYTQILGGTTANDIAGTKTINGGVLALAKTPGVDAIADAPIVLNGGSLRLDANNQINNSADMTLSGGTFNLNGKSETLDVASLTANSILDFGTLAGNSTLLFSSLTRTGGILTVNNWDGLFLPGGGGNDQFRVTSLPLTTVLSNIQFSPTAVYPLGFLPGARAINFGSYFELVPTIPEPVGVSILGLGALISLSRRRK